MANRVLITGGTGFAGSHLVEHLKQVGSYDIHVTTFKQTGSFDAWLPRENVHPLDLTDAAATNTLLDTLQPDIIFHLAAFATQGNSFEQAQAIMGNNLHLQLCLLEGVRLHAPKARTLIVGSAMEYDVLDAQRENPGEVRLSEKHRLGPISPYAVSKVLQDLLGLSYHYSYQLDIVRARPFNHIGERQTTDFAVSSFAHQIVAVERKQQTELTVGNLTAVRDFSDVKDVVAGYHILMEKGIAGEVYNIGSGQGHTMQNILDLMISMSTVSIPVIQDPAKFRPLDVPSVIANNTKIAALGWQPKIPLSETLKRVLMYWRATE